MTERGTRVDLTKNTEPAKPASQKDGQTIAEGVTKSNGTTVLFEDVKREWAPHPFYAKRNVLPWDK